MKLHLPIFLCLGLLNLIALSAADTITFSAQKVKSTYAAGKEKTQLIGGAHIQTGNITINSEEIELSGAKQRYVQSKGAVFIHDGKRNLDIRGDSLFYDRETDILQLSGNTQLEDFKNEMLVRGGILESRNKENIAIVQVGVRVFKKDIIARSEMLLYRRDDDLVELSGLPVVFKKDDEYRASTITIDLKTEEIQMTGKVQGTVQTKTNKSPEPSGNIIAPTPANTVNNASPTPNAADGVGADKGPEEVPKLGRESVLKTLPPKPTQKPVDGNDVRN